MLRAAIVALLFTVSLTASAGAASLDDLWRDFGLTPVSAPAPAFRLTTIDDWLSRSEISRRFQSGRWSMLANVWPPPSGRTRTAIASEKSRGAGGSQGQERRWP